MATSDFVKIQNDYLNIDVADMLNAVASFQQDAYTMTSAEASAIADTAKTNRPKVRVRSLPTLP